jgi:hypothetical protein
VVHHISGFCSAPPPGIRITGLSSNALAATVPDTDITALLGPDVPRSIARINFSLFFIVVFPHSEISFNLSKARKSTQTNYLKGYIAFCE